MTTSNLPTDIEAFEGLRLTAYPDAESELGQACAKAGLDPTQYKQIPRWQTLPGAPWTIGYGHTGKEVVEGLVWTLAQAQQAMITDILAVKSQLDSLYAWWRSLSDVRQDVLVNMVFNIGIGKLRGFKNFLWALRRGDFPTAAEEMANSDWAREVPRRADWLISCMKADLRQPLPA